MSENPHFWMKRYYDFNVYSQPKIAEKVHYMHLNPVVRRLVERPEQWEWSSFRTYACREMGGEASIGSFLMVGKSLLLATPVRSGAPRGMMVGTKLYFYAPTGCGLVASNCLSTYCRMPPLA